ncbi:MAG: alpha/beta fold hydrolase [Candidatus Binatia bacterium]
MTSARPHSSARLTPPPALLTAPMPMVRLGHQASRLFTLARSHASTLLAGLLFGLSAWQANRAVCPGCAVSDVALTLPDGTPIHSRLYLPARTGTTEHGFPRPLGEGQGEGSADTTSAHLPAVIVCPGYLANLALMEIPWAAELTRLGAAVLFLDRRGQGESGGALWLTPVSQKLDDLNPDVAAAIIYIRSREPLVDPERVAILGHSDGATAALMAASADWDVRATVAVSASLAPWQLVNHVAPQNLLLVYGAEDHFVLNDTDGMLIAHATRGYLAGPGEFGDFADGSARRLIRVAERGHLDVLYSDVAHREILEWFRRSLQANGDVVLSSNELNWVWSGVGALVLFLARPTNRHVSCASASAGRFIARMLALAVVWGVGLLLSPWLARLGHALVPGEEGAVFGALLLGPAISLAAGTVFWRVFRRVFPAPRTSPGAVQQAAPVSAHRAIAGRTKEAAGDAALGLVVATLLFVALHMLLLHHYEIGLNVQRVTLLSIFTSLALLTFSALEIWVRWAAGASDWRMAGCLVLLALVTAVLSRQLFERMSMAPGYLLAAVLVVTAAYSLGGGTGRPVRVAVFGALTISWIGAVVCALY